MGYVSISKADGSQTVDLEKDPLVAAGVTGKLISGVRTVQYQLIILNFVNLVSPSFVSDC